MLEVLKAISEPNRVKILQLLKSEELNAGDIASHFDVSRPAISQHLRVLVDSGVLNERRLGVQRLYSIKPEGFSTLKEFLDSIWNQRLSRLKNLSERKKK